MADLPLTLPKGRHRLTRQQVADAQRLRLAVAMAEALAEQGYAGTPVAPVLERAGVSRQTFYQLYDGKLACFLDALDFVGEVLIAELAGALDGPGEPIDHAVGAIGHYLGTIVANSAFARLYLVEVHAAGPEALIRRSRLQARIVDALAALLGLDDAASRFACEAFVAAVSSLVVLPIVTGDDDAVRALEDPLGRLLRDLAAQAT